MLVGYSSCHDGDCCDMWDPNTHKIHQCRDVTWLKRMFYLKPAGDVRVGGGFENTKELKVMTYNEAKKSKDKKNGRP